jgi:hypothetical protein
MKKITLAITFIAVGVAGAIVACNSSEAKTAEDDNSPAFHYTKEQAEHGKYLVTAMGCNDCHTPLKMGPMGPEPDMARALSGHPMEVPVPHVDTSALNDWVMFNHTTLPLRDRGAFHSPPILRLTQPVLVTGPLINLKPR